MRFLWIGAVAFAVCSTPASPSGAPQSIIYTEAPRFEPSSNPPFPSGAKLHLAINDRSRPLVPTFAASSSACVSFDGKRILFSGKQKPADHWRIWEVPLAGGVPRPLTSGTRDAITPYYLPLDRIVYAVHTDHGFQIELVPRDLGVAPLRLTYAPGDHLISDVLLDGRILFEAPHAASVSGARDLFTVYSDGSGVETYRCDHGHDRRGGRQLSSGDVLFVATGRLAKFVSPRAVEVAVEAPAGEFAGPVAELPGSEALIACRPNASVPFRICRLNPGAQGPVRDVIAPAGMQAVEPVIAAPRRVPKIHPSALGNREGSNLLCLNVYTSRKKIAKGSVTAVRVWSLDERGTAIPLGTAPVEPDGSFYTQLPSERPLRFELLDSSGAAVAAEVGWFWTRRGEQRVCVGCHAGPERAPENVVPQVLLRSTEPVKMLNP